MADPKYSQVIMENLATVNKRVENADAYFASIPEGLNDARITAAYNELRMRQSFLIKAKRLLDYLQDKDECTTDTMPTICLRFYNYTISPFMYDNQEQKDKYADSVDVLLKVYPDWIKRLEFRAKNIKKAISGTDTIHLLFALKSFVELCVELFLWIRQKVNPIKDQKA